MDKTILIADDHLNVRVLVADYLQEQGYRVVTARDGADALQVAQRERPDLIVLDLTMPTLDGFAFLHTYRKGHAVPVIILTTRPDEADKIVGLELGADDYVTKPFSLKELEARIRAVLRRSAAGPPAAPAEVLRVGDLVLDRTSRTVQLRGTAVALTPSEFALLAVFMESPGRVYTRPQLLEQLQGDPFAGEERTVNVHIANLRKKLEHDPHQLRYIETVFGVGYRCRPAGEGSGG
jgi:DNA-binding response OmpR family regulator